MSLEFLGLVGATAKGGENWLFGLMHRMRRLYRVRFIGFVCLGFGERRLRSNLYYPGP